MISLNINHHYFYKPQGALMNLMFSRMARQVSVTLVHLFSPVYIYTVLLSKNYTASLAISFVLAYYFLAFLVKIITQYFAENLSGRVGFKNTMRFSVIPYSIFILSLSFANSHIFLFFLAAISWGLHAGLFWWGYHGYFIKKGEKEHFGTTIGEANLMEAVASVATPIAGALIISHLGFPSLFFFSFLFVVASMFLLGKGSSTRQKHDIKAKDILKLISDHKMTALAYVGLGAESIIAVVVWPLFLYLYFGRVVSLGVIVSLAALLASLFSVAIGSKVDLGKEEGIVRIGSIVLFSSWLIRVLSGNIGIFVVGDSLRNFGHRMVLLPLNTLSYKKAIESGSSKAILFFETTIIIGVLSAILIIWYVIQKSMDLKAAFLVSTVFSLFPLFWSIKKKE